MLLKHQDKLPWPSNKKPLMLAPMQGLTNRALRSLFIKRYAPDVVFTEFVRVITGHKKIISKSDKLEILSDDPKIPTVVQLIGGNPDALAAAAHSAQELGAKHLNINLGCPYGRMNNGAAGGNLLGDPGSLSEILSSLRKSISGSFSVKLRSGFDDPGQVLKMIPLLEESGVDFIIIHPRTVKQGFSGQADHQVTTELVKLSSLPVIANGDICTAAEGHQVLQQTGAAGLMIGRGAIADPFIFERLRGNYPAMSTESDKVKELQGYLQGILPLYQELFCGEHQVIYKMREVLNQVHDPDIRKTVGKLKKAKSIMSFSKLLGRM